MGYRIGIVEDDAAHAEVIAEGRWMLRSLR